MIEQQCHFLAGFRRRTQYATDHLDVADQAAGRPGKNHHLASRAVPAFGQQGAIAEHCRYAASEAIKDGSTFAVVGVVVDMLCTDAGRLERFNDVLAVRDRAGEHDRLLSRRQLAPVSQDVADQIGLVGGFLKVVLVVIQQAVDALAAAHLRKIRFATARRCRSQPGSRRRSVP